MAAVAGRSLRSGAVLEVEVADDGGAAWRPARILRVLVAEPLKFHVCVDGDPEFVEEYVPSDEGDEWRWPADEAAATRAYHARVAEHHAAHPDMVPLQPFQPEVGAGAGADEAALAALATVSRGQLLEVEVDGGSGVGWKPAEVINLLPGGSFVVCVNGEQDFVETYARTEEDAEWRRPDAEALPALTAAHAAAKAAWAEGNPGTAVGVNETGTVEAVVSERRAAAGRGHEFFVKVGRPDRKTLGTLPCLAGRKC